MLYIAFIWHMHQPYYRDSLTGEATLPWVRLHGIKDYLDMVSILKGFPHIHQTFNLVPCLLEQLENYVSGRLTDKFLELSRKRAAELSDKDKDFMLLYFFSAHQKNMIETYPRYYDLFLKRGRQISPERIERIRQRFKLKDFLDLQVWFNLAWFDPSFKENIPELKELIGKGEGFSEEEKEVVLNKQIDILTEIIPTYKELQDSGQIEITTSPYFHPILPLVYNMGSAKEAMPEVTLPKEKIGFPEDVRWHIGEAVSFYRQHFGIPPRGFWPSECAVSEDILEPIIDNGIDWMVSDEEILFRSINKPRSAELLYRPYLLKRKDKTLNVIFRDRTLSDLIGFTYYRWPTDKAVDDLMGRLQAISATSKEIDGPKLVTVALDGENAWEYYPNDGRDFLLSLYARIDSHPELKAVTVSEFLKMHPPQKKIKRLFAGSWIDANFAIWVGEKEKNLAWEYLAKARAKLKHSQPARLSDSKLKAAWRQIYIAEGSDWNWWYGRQFNSFFYEEFDRIFRRHLSGVYTLIDEPIPGNLKFPIKSKRIPLAEPVSLIGPIIDGNVSSYQEWLGAGYLDASQYGGPMRRMRSLVHYIYYGFDLNKFYVRVDVGLPKEENAKEGLRFILLIIPKEIRIEIPFSLVGNRLKGSLFRKGEKGNWIEIKQIQDVAFDRVLELGIDFEDLGVKASEEFKFSLSLEKKGGLILESHPPDSLIRVKVPDSNYESYMWSA